VSVHPILFIGDSITAGIRMGLPFWKRLDGINAALPGATLEAFVDPGKLHEPPAVLTHGLYRLLVEPNVPVKRTHIMLGHNDMGFRHSDGNQYRERMLHLIGRMRLAGCKEFWLSTGPYPCQAHPNLDQTVQLIDWNHNVNVALSQTEKHVYMGGDFRLMDHRDHFEDCFHPNQLGHDMIASELGGILP
jgi:lysophospholipase L1-like esterase